LVWAIPIVAVTLGFLPAIALGLVAACLLFVFVYAQIDVVRLFTTAANLKARVERNPVEREALRRQGERIHIYKLTGFLFFGTTERLLAKLQQSLVGATPPRVIVVDLQRIVGLDLAAWDAFDRLARRCAQHGAELKLTGLSAPLQQQFRPQLAALKHPQFEVVGNLDTALATLEEQSLAGLAKTRTLNDDRAKGARDDHEEVIAILHRHGQRRAFRAGECVMREGDVSDCIMVLLSGRLDVSVGQATGGEATLNRLLPGALFGEVAFYSRRERSATVVAGVESAVLEVTATQMAALEAKAPADAAKLHRALARAVADRLIAATLLLKDADL
jgi:SulP family sulfate permease